MDAETLKIILELKEENTLYKMAMGDILLMLKGKKKFQIMQYPMINDDFSFIFNRIDTLFKEKGE